MSTSTGSNAPVSTASLSAFRVVLAGIVSASHALTLTGWNTSWDWSFGKAAELAVLCFFSISGFLVAQSFYRSSSWSHYLTKRALRIYPAYVAAILLFFGLLNLGYAASISLRNISEQAYYLIANLLFLNFLKPSLPGIFADNPHPFINGALWTIKIEVLFYCLLPPVLAFGKRAGTRLILLCCYTATCVLLQRVQAGVPGSIDYHLFRELLLPLAHFVAGILYLVFSETLPTPTLRQVVPLWLVALPLSLLVTDHTARNPLLQAILAHAAPLFLTAATLTTARLKPGCGISQLPDLSYSLYLTHFPVTQVCCALGLHNRSPALYWIAVLSAQSGVAFLFWKWVEHPALKFRDQRR